MENNENAGVAVALLSVSTISIAAALIGGGVLIGLIAIPCSLLAAHHIRKGQPQ